ELSEFFNYPAEIRKIMYTTNIIESLNSSFRRTTKARNIFSTDQSLMKLLYLSSENITKKWTQKVRGWESILRMLSIEFEESLKGHL
ncbi:transposase, partial [Psychrilyobacter sp.]|uniref:transposase n=1 Tax=Psychrilyobacter sp. TaxID=2586924 RepID=UPI0030171325